MAAASGRRDAARNNPEHRLRQEVTVGVDPGFAWALSSGRRALPDRVECDPGLGDA